MTVVVQKPGLQTTLQSWPRIGNRHLGVPSSGPADALSMALANRLVGNDAFAPALETTLTGVTLTFTTPTFVAVTGCVSKCALGSDTVPQHVTLAVRKGDVLTVGAAEKGVRNYVAIAGGLEADNVLGSTSTYMTAGFGGHQGRALEVGDELEPRRAPVDLPMIETPPEYRIPILDNWSVRAGWSCETGSLVDQRRLFTEKFVVGNRCDRMGIKLEGEAFESDVGGQMPSVPVFPGTIQCPQDGNLFVMSVDSGTTGGYPRVAKIARMDLHILGQLRPGNSIRFIERSDDIASSELLEKHDYWQPWLPDVASAI